jgi:hypothetical protein
MRQVPALAAEIMHPTMDMNPIMASPRISHEITRGEFPHPRSSEAFPKDRSKGSAIVAPEVGNRLEVRLQASQQPR